MQKKERAQEIFKRLKKEFPKARCALDHENPFQLLIATILSAQCTDERVNKVTPELFKHFPDPQTMSQAPVNELEKLIHSTGFFKNKAKSILGCSQTIVNEHGGEVPQVLEELTAMPGVGRKTANVVLGNAFGIVEGIVVDTHVTRLSQLLGLTKNTNAEKIELDLIKLFEKKQWVLISHFLILHGRKTCIARRPQCQNCCLAEICPSRKKI